VDARSILGVQQLRTPLLDDVSSAGAEGEACARARSARIVINFGIFMSRYALDDPDDDVDEDDDDDFDDDGDDEDEDEDNGEEEETWQV
jgi:hypothetical protein